MAMRKLLVTALILIVGGMALYILNRPSELPIAPKNSAAASNTATPTPAPAGWPATSPRISIGSVDIPVELAQTSEEIQKGLSGRPSLDADKGMLFLFAQADIYSFWMPDMRFPLDIIWISSDKKVVGVSADIPNDFDPANPKFYRPPAPARYVLEVNAGFAARTDIRTGDSVMFTNI